MHCQAAIAEFAALWEPVDRGGHTRSGTAGMTTTVMSQIQSLVHDVWYTLQTTDLGAIRIAARIVATMASDSARMVPGVGVALGRSSQGKLAALAERASLGTVTGRGGGRARPHRRGGPRRGGLVR